MTCRSSGTFRFLLGLLLALLLGLAALGLVAARLLQQQGVEQLHWRGLRVSSEGLQLARLQLRIRDELRLDLRQLQARPLHGKIAVKSLELTLNPGEKSDTLTPASLTLSQTLGRLAWLPRHLQIERFQAHLPCQQGQCSLLGTLNLDRAEQGLPLALQVQLQHDSHRLELTALLQGEPQAPDLQAGLSLDQQPRLALLASLRPSAAGLAVSGQLQIPAQRELGWLGEWLSQWSDLQAPLQDWPQSLQAQADWQLQLPSQTLDADNLRQAAGGLRLDLQLPDAWPLPGIGLLQGRLQAELAGSLQHPSIAHLSSDLHWQPAAALREALPKGLDLQDIQLQLTPISEAPADAGLPVALHANAQGNGAQASLSGRLLLPRQAPWQLTGEDLQLRLKSPRLALDGLRLDALDAQLALNLTLTPQRLQLQLPSASLQLAGLRLPAADLQLGNTRVQSRAASLDLPLPLDLPHSALQLPLEVTGSALRQTHLQAANWRWQGPLRLRDGQWLLQGQLGLDDTLLADLGLRRNADGVLSLQGEAREPLAASRLATHLPDWPALLSLDAGRLYPHLRLTQQPRGWQGQLTLRGEDLAGTYDRSEFAGLDLQLGAGLDADTLRLTLPRLRIERLNPGLPLGPLDFSGSYQAPLSAPQSGHLDWQRLNLGVFDGTAQLQAGSWSLERDARLQLHLDGLRLESLLAAYPTEGLDGQGLIDGQLPLHWDGHALRVEDGHLAARAPGGVLRFSTPKLQAMARANPGMNLVTEALENFHFAHLSSSVGYDERGTLRLGLRLEGRNPDLEGGRPINFNINLEEDVPALLTSLQLSDRVNQRIQQRVQQRLQRPPAQTETP